MKKDQPWLNFRLDKSYYFYRVFESSILFDDESNDDDDDDDDNDELFLWYGWPAKGI